MNMKESVVTCYRKSFSKEGRASRSEYWWFILFLYCMPLVVGLVVNAGKALGAPHFFLSLLGLAFLLFMLFAPFPVAFAQTRRLHDTGRSGWWTIAPLAMSLMAVIILGYETMQAARTHSVPLFIQSLVGARLISAHGWLVVGLLAWIILNITIFVFMVMPGNTGDNRFGPDPLDRSPSYDDRSPPSSGSGARQSLSSQAHG